MSGAEGQDILLGPPRPSRAHGNPLRGAGGNREMSGLAQSVQPFKPPYGPGLPVADRPCCTMHSGPAIASGTAPSLARAAMEIYSLAAGHTIGRKEALDDAAEAGLYTEFTRTA